MPVDDAINLVMRDFNNYKSGGRSVPTNAVPAHDRHPDAIQVLLNMLSDNLQLTVLQYERVIKYLEMRREEQVQFELGEDAKNLGPSSLVSDPKQAELQSRILNILNSNKNTSSTTSTTTVITAAPSPVPPPAGKTTVIVVNHYKFILDFHRINIARLYVKFYFIQNDNKTMHYICIIAEDLFCVFSHFTIFEKLNAICILKLFFVYAVFIGGFYSFANRILASQKCPVLHDVQFKISV